MIIFYNKLYYFLHVNANSDFFSQCSDLKDYISIMSVRFSQNKTLFILIVFLLKKHREVKVPVFLTKNYGQNLRIIFDNHRDI